MKDSTRIHPLLQTVLHRLESVGEVVVSSDGHLFFQPGVHIRSLWGAMDMKKEGIAAGMRIVVRKVRKRACNSRYAGMPWYQIYVLPVLRKDASTMTANEQHNMDINRQALLMAHAIERDPEQAAVYRKLHEAHKLNPVGYKKLYPNFFGFLVATCRMQIVAQQAVSQTPEQENSPVCPTPANTSSLRPVRPLSVAPASDAGVTLCVPFAFHTSAKAHGIRRVVSVVPRIRYPVAA